MTTFDSYALGATNFGRTMTDIIPAVYDINVQMFYDNTAGAWKKAYADGVKDDGGIINAALVEANRKGGGIVRLQPGATYLITTPIVWQPKTSIVGHYSTLKPSATAAHVITMGSDMHEASSYFNRLEGLNFDLSAWTQNDYAVYLTEQIQYPVFRNIIVTGRSTYTQGAFYIKPGAAELYYHGTFDNCRLTTLNHASGAVCIDGGPTNLTIGNCWRFNRVGWTTFKKALTIVGEQVILDNCLFNMPVGSFRIGPNDDYRVVPTRVDDTHFTVTGNLTSYFPAGKLCYIKYADGTYGTSVIVGSAYTSVTTVELTDAIVTASPAPAYTWYTYVTNANYHPFSGDSVPVITMTAAQVVADTELNPKSTRFAGGWVEGGASTTTYDYAPVMVVAPRAATAGVNYSKADGVYGLSNQLQMIEPYDAYKYAITAAESLQKFTVAGDRRTTFPVGASVLIWNITDDYFATGVVTVVALDGSDTDITIDRPCLRSTSITSAYVWKVPIGSLGAVNSDFDRNGRRYGTITETVTTSLQLTAKHMNGFVYINNGANNVTVNLPPGDTASEGHAWVRLIKGGAGTITVGVSSGYYVNTGGSGSDIANTTSETEAWIELIYQRVSRWSAYFAGTWAI